MQGRHEKPLIRGVRLNLHEFTWLKSCSIVINHYLFQCLKTVLFGYLYAVGGRRTSMVTKDFNLLNFLSYPVSIIGSTMFGPGEKFSKEKLSDNWKVLF